VQLPVGDLLVDFRVVAFPDDGYLVTALRQVAVQAVVRGVQFGAFEPGDPGLVVVPVPYLVPGLDPVDERLGLLGPESLRVGDGPLVHLVVLVLVDVCASGDVRGNVVQF
jgi:hypothetical protein